MDPQIHHQMGSEAPATPPPHPHQISDYPQDACSKCGISTNLSNRWQNEGKIRQHKLLPKLAGKQFFWKLNVFVFNENGDPIAD